VFRSSVIGDNNHAAYKPLWPSPYSGVAPDKALGSAFNNVGVYDTAESTIYTCVRILTGGLAGSASGISKFDIGLEVVSLGEATVQIVKFREFNLSGALNKNGQTPDCSGTFKLTTGVYTNTISVGGSTIETSWKLLDPAILKFGLTR